MSLTSVEIEQISADAWVARVEVGGLIAKRVQVNAPTFDAIIAATVGAYRDLSGLPVSPTAAPAADRRVAR